MFLKKRVVVTGASGFIGMHTIVLLLNRGYQVRGTLRRLNEGERLRKELSQYSANTAHLEFVYADLSKDEGWREAVTDCFGVIHTASPVPLMQPKDENELIGPARDGTLRLLHAAHDAGIGRVVLVSSVAAISNGHAHIAKNFDEKDWTDLTNRSVKAYAKSKSLAEQAAWTFIEGDENKKQMQLVSINPTFVLGPLLDDHYVASGEFIATFLKGKFPGVPRIKYHFVDVRDVAEALLLALTTPAAAGQRFICNAENWWLKDVAIMLASEFNVKGYRVPTRILPSFLVRFAALFDRRIARISSRLDWDYSYSNELIRAELKWEPRAAEETIIEMAESMIKRYSLLPKS